MWTKEQKAEIGKITSIVEGKPNFPDATEKKYL